MGFSATSGSSTINGDVEVEQKLNVPGSNQTPVCVFLAAANNGATIHTTTAGKTFYCTGVSVMSVNAGNTYAGVAVDGTTKLRMISKATLPAVLFTGGILFTAAAGKAITLIGDFNAGEGYVNVWGFEQTN